MANIKRNDAPPTLPPLVDDDDLSSGDYISLGMKLRDPVLLPEQDFVPNYEQQPIINQATDEIVDFVARRAQALAEKRPIVRALARKSQMIHGGPGAGKSTMIAAINKEAAKRGAKLLIVAPMAAIANAIGGMTIHGAAGLDIKKWRRLTDLEVEKLQARVDAENVALTIGDEVSATPCELLYSLHKNLCRIFVYEGYFGGKPLILFGDWFQLPPPGAKNCAVYDAIIHRFLDKDLNISDAEKFVADFFIEQIDVTDLVLNERSKKDPKLALLVKNLRTKDPLAFPIRDFLIPILPSKVITVAAVKERPEWILAPILINGNRLRTSIVAARGSIIARELGVPFIRWRLPITSNIVEFLSEEQLDELYENDSRLWGYYIQGYAGYIRHNINPDRAVSNGTTVTGYSLTLQGNDDDEENDQHMRVAADWSDEVTDSLNDEARLERARPGDEVVLTRPPFSVNVELTGKRASEYSDASIVSKRAVLPILAAREVLDSCFIPGFGSVTLSVSDHNFDLASAATFYKAQGRNMTCVLADLNPPASLPHLSYSGIFVWNSRGYYFDDCKVMPLHDPSQGWDHLRALRVPENLVAFLNGFQPDGSGWSADLANAARDKYRAAEAVHPHSSLSCLSVLLIVIFYFLQRPLKPSAAPSAPSGLVVPPLAPSAPPNPPAPPNPLAPPAPPNPPALKGLPNLGNTCYLNTSVQCLLSFPQFQNIFLPDCYRQGLNAANLNGNSTCFEFLIESEAVYVNRIIPTRSGLKGHLALSFGKLAECLWQQKSSATSILQAVNAFKKIIGSYNAGNEKNRSSFYFRSISLLAFCSFCWDWPTRCARVRNIPFRRTA